MTKFKKFIWPLVIAAVIALLAGGYFVVNSEMTANEITIEEAQKAIDDSFSSMDEKATTDSVKYIISQSKLTVEKIESYGNEKDILLTCSYSGLDLSDITDDIMDDVMAVDFIKSNGMMKTSSAIKKDVSSIILEYLEGNEISTVSGTVPVTLVEVEGKLVLYTSDELMDTVFYGLVTSAKELKSLSEWKGEKLQKPVKDGVGLALVFEYDKTKPEGAVGIAKAINKLKADFKLNFIEDSRWKFLTTGLANTLKITALAALIGIALGFIVAIIRTTHDKSGKLKVLNVICQFYLTVIRGTPVVVQLMIIYFVMLMPIGVPKLTSAVLCFGINSGAYVAEIVRGGIMSIDKGQTEAGRSLGFNYVQTMWYIIIPQTIKAVLPSLANEFIALLKESSVSSYIGLADLTKGGDIIRGRTFSAFMPLIAVAIIYLVMVLGLSKLVSLLERRLNKSDRG